MKTDSLMNALTKYIDKRINEKYSNISMRKTIYRYEDYDIVIGYSSDGLCLIWKESDVIKMAIGVLENKDGTPTPIMVFGAGNGNGDNRGYLQKDTDGLSIYYVGDLSLGEVSYIKLKKDVLQLNGYDVFSKASAISDSYIASATDWNNKTQNLDSSGDATSMNVYSSGSGSRIELLETDKFQQLNSSSQKHGLYMDTTFTDLELYYNNSLWFEVYNGITELLFKGDNTTFLTYNFVNNYCYPQGTWDFTSCTVLGLSTDTASSHTHTINNDGIHNHGISNGTKLATSSDGINVDGNVTWVESGSHTHTESSAGSHSHTVS